MSPRIPPLVATLALCLLLPVASWTLEGPPPLSESFKKVRDSVVVVRILEGSGATQPKADREYDGLGSGVLIDAEGRVLTAAHVVEGARLISVQFADGEEVPARVAASVGGADVALLELERPPKTALPAHLGRSSDLEVGDPVFVVGAPLGMSTTLSAGYVSGIREDASVVGDLVTPRYIQTDAAINPGNSGGPMFTRDGLVVGVVSYIMSHSGGHEGMGFAVASDTVRALLLGGATAWSGLEGYLLDEELAAAMNVPQKGGLLIETVEPDSPAAALGLRSGTIEADLGGDLFLIGGDVILAVDGIPVGEENLARLREHLRGLTAGRRYEVSVLRAGSRLTLSAMVPGSVAPP